MTDIEIFLLAIATAGLIVIPIWLIVDALSNAKNMLEIGIVLIIVGVLFTWPLAAIGACLVMAHFMQENKKQ